MRGNDTRWSCKPMNSAFASLIAHQHEITLSVLGDSLSYGYLVPAGYFHMLIERLAGDFPSHRIRSRNHGVCGDTAGDGLRRLREALLLPPADIALIQFGINDCFVGVSESEFRAAIARIVQGYRSECPQGIVVLIPPPPVRSPQEDHRLEPFRQAMREWAGMLGVICVSIDEHWIVGESGPAQWLDDGVHPSEQGYRSMASAVYDALTAGIPGQRDTATD